MEEMNMVEKKKFSGKVWLEYDKCYSKEEALKRKKILNRGHLMARIYKIPDKKVWKIYLRSK